MKYRKDRWYIGGLVTTGIAVIIILVTMIMMYFGNDSAIIWCFAAMPVLATGILLSQSVKRRYEEADATNGEPLPMFWRIRFGYHNLKVLVITKGLWRVIFAALTCLFLLLTLVLGFICGYCALSKNSVLNSPKYIKNIEMHEEYRALWSQARTDGDEEKAHEYFAVMEECNKENYNSRKHITDCEATITALLPWTVVTGALTVFSAVIFSAYALHKRKTTI